MSSSHAYAELQRFAAPRADFATSPNDGFVQIAWPLVLILAIVAIVTIEIQQQAIEDLRRASDTIEATGKRELIIELRKQMLLKRVEDVCTEVEEEAIGLSELDSLRGVRIVEGKPEHEGLKKLYGWACTRLDGEASKGVLRSELYLKALGLVREGPFGAQRMYDSKHTERPQAELPDELVLHIYIGNDEASQEARLFAFELIDRHIAEWDALVQNLQWEMIDLMFKDGHVPTGIVDRDSATTLVNVASYLDGLGFSILPAVSIGLRAWEEPEEPGGNGDEDDGNDQ